MVGTTVGSIRSIEPVSSRRTNTSSREVASAAASMVWAARPKATAGSGWTKARFSIHGSRGRIQMIRSEATPLRTSHTMASVAVLPEPTITWALGASTRSASAPTGSTEASPATPNGGGVVAGTAGAR